MMSEKRFEMYNKYNHNEIIYDSLDDQYYSVEYVESLLNKLVDENEQLRQQLAEKNEDERLYAKEIVKLNKEVKDNKFLRLGNDY